VVKFLLDRGADISSQYRDGCTPLHLAAKRGHFKTAEVLVKEITLWHPEMDEGLPEAGKARGRKSTRWEKISPRNHDGDTPRTLAQKNNHHQVTDLSE
jgi:ankyrin repeat protein